MGIKNALLALLPTAATAGRSLIPPPSKLAAHDTKNLQVTMATVGEAVAFTCSGTDPFRIHLYMWDFGDGTITEWGDRQVNHVYQKPGTYEVHAKERCPLIFGKTCFMRTEWSASFVITVKEPDIHTPLAGSEKQASQTASALSYSAPVPPPTDESQRMNAKD